MWPWHKNVFSISDNLADDKLLQNKKIAQIGMCRLFRWCIMFHIYHFVLSSIFWDNKATHIWVVPKLLMHSSNTAVFGQAFLWKTQI